MSLDRKKKTYDLLGICIKAGKAVKGFGTKNEVLAVIETFPFRSSFGIS